jgi:acylphosphatase
VRIDLLPDGEKRILIEGDEEELEGLVETIQEAIDHGHASGAMLDDEGVENVTVRCVVEAAS